MTETESLPFGFISTWIFFSSTIIIFNKWIFSFLPYPIFLTTIHMLYASIGTWGLKNQTDLLDSLKTTEITKETYFKKIVPIGILFSASLILSNYVYLYLTVAFIQMLKAGTPIVVLIFSFIAQLETPSWILFLIICLVSIGVIVASFGEIQFVLIGVIFQIIAIFVESTRLILIQILLSANGLKLDPLCSLYLFAPVCFVTNLICFVALELNIFDSNLITMENSFIIFLNASIAFLLNISAVYLIKNSSSVVYTLSGVIKDILLIVISSIIFQTQVTLLQFIGYAISLYGLVFYNFYKLKKPLEFKTLAPILLAVTLCWTLVSYALSLHLSTFQPLNYVNDNNNHDDQELQDLAQEDNNGTILNVTR